MDALVGRVWWLLLLAPACLVTVPEAPGDAGSLASYARYCDELARVRCDRDLRCGYLGTVEHGDCLSWTKDKCFARSSALARGGFVFDPSATGMCLGELGRISCADEPYFSASPAFMMNPVFDICTRVLKPNAGLGAACAWYDECAVGACLDGVASCGRTCQRFGANPGSSCTEGWPDPCDPSTAYCALPVDGGSRGVCVAKSRGGACTASGRWPPGLGYVGDGFEQCPKGDYCRGLRRASWLGSWTAGVCAARLAGGAPCINEQFDDGCADSEESCVDGVCKRIPLYSRPAGAECDGFFQCASSLHCAGGFFLADGGPNVGGSRCRPRLSEGEPCDWGCAEGLRCSYLSTPTRCVRPPRLGEGCESDCSSFATCSGDAGDKHCVAWRKLGQSCGGSRGYCSNGFCRFDAGLAPGLGECTAQRSDGAECLEFAECTSWRCESPDGGFPRVCTGSCP